MLNNQEWKSAFAPNILISDLIDPESLINKKTAFFKSSILANKKFFSTLFILGLLQFGILNTFAHTTAENSDSYKSNNLSNNADLANLALSTGTISPVFVSGTLLYTASVSNATSSITLTPAAAEGTATIKVNGIPVASAAASGSIALAVGSTTITTIVTAGDGITTKTYTVILYREGVRKYWNTDNVSRSLNTNNWSSTAAGPFIDPYADCSHVVFSANSNITYVFTSNVVLGISIANASTVNWFWDNNPYGNSCNSTYGHLSPFDIDAGSILYWNGQPVSIKEGTGFIKNGEGAWHLGPQPSPFPGGFILNAGSIILGSHDNVIGVGPLTINGGVVAGNGTAVKVPAVSSISIANDFMLGNSPTLPNADGSIIFNSGVALGSNQTRTITVGGNIASNQTGVYTFNGIIAGANSSIIFDRLPASTGRIVLGGANTYNGGTTIKAGKVSFGASGVLADAGAITLSGGALNTGFTTGFSETAGTLKLTANSTIELGTGSHTLAFAASNGQSWTGSTMLTITGWSGVYNGTASATAGKIFVGTDASGISPAQLAQIQFTNPSDGINYTARILSTGEIVPNGSTNANLSNITLSTGTLVPVFASGIISYTATVNHTTTSLTLTPTAAEGTATITVNGITVASATASGSINLSVGTNTITTIVTAGDGTTTKTYTVTITRISNDATLSNIALSSGTLSPGFASGTINYTTSVSNTTTSITLTPTSSNNQAVITVNGITVASTAASASIPLAEGNNTITTIVTAEDGTTTKTYTVTVTRQSSNLSALSISTGILSPAFNSGIISYNTTVSNATTSIRLTPTALESMATITVNGTPVASGAASGSIALSTGLNQITIVVTAGDGTTTKTYTVDVYKAGTAIYWSTNTEFDVVPKLLVSSNWSTTGTGPFNQAYTSCTNLVFTANSKIQHSPGSNYVLGITITNGSTVNWTADVTYKTACNDVVGGINTFDIGAGSTLIWNGQVVYSVTGAGFIKNGEGTWNIGAQSGAYNGGFILNAGTIRLGNPANTIGAGPLTINGGVIAGNGTVVKVPAVTSITINNDFMLGNSPTLTTADASITFNRGVVLGSNQTRTITVGGNIATGSTGVYTFNGIIAGTNSSIIFDRLPASTGRIVLGGANTYNGGTTIKAGKVSFGASGVLADAGAITLSGGALNTGFTTGFSETAGTLKLTANSTIELGTGSHTLAFAASNGQSWTGSTMLTITGWSGVYNGTASATAGKIFVGTDASGISPAQLAQIQFTNPSDGINYTARILSTGEIVPNGSTNANLSNITLSTGTLSPVFASETTSYTATVSNATTSITLTPTAAEGTATITVNGATVASGAASASIPLAVGTNTTTTVVTAGDGTTTNTYTLTVTRISNDANLSALVLSTGTLSPVFASGTINYTTSVSNTTTSITLTPTSSNNQAVITVNGTTVASGAASASIPLAVGTNTITTVVTAGDGTTTKTYTVTITRAISTDANLSNITLSTGTLVPGFASGTTNYSTSVSNATTSITLTPTAAEGTATITVNGITVASATASGSINLSVGTNTITTIVTAGDGTTTKTYTVTVTRFSNDATLSNIALSSGTLSPLFASGTLSYTATVSNTTTSLTLTPTSSNNQAVITVNGTTIASATASGSIPLAVGTNTITTVVTAGDGTTTKTYTLTVTRAVSANADLSNIALNSGTLSPVFASGTINYTTSVSNATTSITLTPIASEGTATIKVNGTTVTSAAASGSIALSVGTNTITTVVTAGDGTTTKTYTVTVNRAASANADLSNIALSSGTLSPVFASGTISYTASVGNLTTSLTLTPTAAEGTATIKVNGTTVTSAAASGSIALSVGTNTITTVVTAGDGTTTKTYTVTVTRAASANADLSNIALSSGTLSPVFASGTISYTASVGNLTTSITLTPTAAEGTATIKVNGTTVVSGATSASIPLAVGANIITTVVTAEDGTTTKTYTVTVNRAASANADLSNIALSSGTLSPVFVAGTISYSTSVSNATTSVTLTPTAAEGTATIKVNGTTVASAAASGSIALSVGANIITTVVTAGDGTTTKTYTLTLTRAASANADLSNIELSSGTLSPVFASGTISYSSSVGNLTTSITLTPTAAEGTATIKVNGTTVASAAASGSIALVVGANIITSVVTAGDGTTTKTYTVTVNRAASANADLAALTSTVGTITPAFTSAITSYNTSVGSDIASLSVTPTAADPTATIQIRINSGSFTDLASATASTGLNLNVGANTIEIKVTAGDGKTTKTYVVSVVRATPIPPAQAINFNALPVKIYGAADFDPGASATSGLAVSYSSSNPAVATIVNGKIRIIGIGISMITATQNGLPGFSPATPASQTLTVVKAPLVITANDVSKIPGDKLSGGSGSKAFTINGLINGDQLGAGTVTITYGKGAVGGDSPGYYPNQVLISALSGQSFSTDIYDISYVNGAIAIGNSIISTTGTLSALVTTYGTASGTTSFSISGSNMAGDILIKAPEGFEVSFSAGSGFASSLNLPRASGGIVNTTTIYVRITSSTAAGNSYSGNVSLTSVGTATVNVPIATSAVNPANLNISALDNTKTYGMPNPAFIVEYSGFMNGDNPGSLSSKPIIGTTAHQFSSVGTYPVSVSGAAGSNYIITYKQATLSITSATLTIKADDQEKLFGQDNPPLSLTYVGFVGTDNPNNLIALPTVSTTATRNSLSGKYPIIVTGAVAPNYNIIYVNGTITINGSSNARITNLTISNVKLVPAFSPGMTNYRVVIPVNITEVTVTATFEAGATATIDQVQIPNGSPSHMLRINDPDETVIAVTIMAQDGKTTITYTITLVKAVLEPNNVLTPNSDEKNDVWVVKNIENYPDNTVSIFDSTGRILYFKKGYNNDWDGRINNSPLVENTYYYIINPGPQIPPKKGFISLIRDK